MLKTLSLLALAPLGFALCACAAASSTDSKNGADGAAAAPRGAVHAESGESEETVALDSVPADVRSAASGAVAGIVFCKAERETENGATVYTLCGTANGKTYEVEVSAAGKVLEVEGGECEECHEDGEKDDK